MPASPSGDPAPGPGPRPDGDPRARAAARLRAAMETGDPGRIERCTEQLLAPHVTWLGSAGGACHSRDEVLTVLRTQLDEGLSLSVMGLEPVADQMLLCLELRPPTGVRRPVLPWRVLLTLDEDGRIVHMQDYADPDAARRDMALRTRGPAAGPPGPGSVTGLVPFVHVADVAASVAFYGLLGFRVVGRHASPDGTLGWVSLEAGEARVMLARATAPVAPEEQAVLFYLYSPALAALRDRLVTHGVLASEIVDGTPGPREEMRVADPDGYTLMIAQLHG